MVLHIGANANYNAPWQIQDMDHNMARKTQSNVHSIKAHEVIERNPGMAFEPDLFGRIRINRSAVERRAATIGTRRSVKKDYQAAWLLGRLVTESLDLH